MKNEFEMSIIDEMNFFLGLKIMEKKYDISISQAKYSKDLLKTFGLESCKTIDTQMVIGKKLYRKDETPTIKKKKCIWMICGLQYLSHTRLDIENVVGIVARFQDDPKECHYATTKRIFIYLKGTLYYGLWYDIWRGFTFCAYTNEEWMKGLVVENFSLDKYWFLGWVRSKIMFHIVKMKLIM